MRTTIANPAGTLRKQVADNNRRAKQLSMKLPDAEVKTIVAAPSRRMTARPATTSKRARERRLRADKTAETAWRRALKDISGMRSTSAPAKKPRKAPAKRAATPKKEKKAMAGRTPKQIASTKRLVAFNKANAGSPKATRKPAKASQRRPKGAKRMTFKWPARVTVTRKNPSLPEVARIVGGTLIGAAVGAAGVVGVGMLMNKYPMSHNAQMAALVAAGVIVGAGTSTISPLAGAAAAMPMFAAAAQLLSSTMTATAPVAGIISPRQMASVAGVLNPQSGRQVAGMFDPRTGQPWNQSRNDVQGLAARFSKTG